MHNVDVATIDSPKQPNRPRLSVSECTAAQLAIDAEIEDIPSGSSSEYALNLRAKRNAYAPINMWFSTDVMVAIFYEIVITSRSRPSKYHDVFDFDGFNFSRTWIVIMHICKCWRTIAISTPHLWEGISLVHPDVTAIMLQRSKPLPIVIKYRVTAESDGDNPPNALSMALSHANRASEIRLQMPTRWLHDSTISRHLMAPMPVLKHLMLSPGGRSSGTIHGFLPSGCLERANTLIRLRLTGIRPLPGAVFPTTLTELDLNSCFPEFFTVSQMLALLEPLENLRDLRLGSALRSDSTDPTSRPFPRRLSPRTNLRHFHIRDTVRMMSEFMCRFPITPATQTRLISFPSALEDFWVGAMLRPVYGARGLLRGLLISQSIRIEIAAYVSTSVERDSSDMCFHMLLMPAIRTGFDETFRDLFVQMPFDSVETLVLESSNDWTRLSKTTAQLLASHLYGVRTLTVQDGALESVIQVMHPQADGNGPAFPCIRTLTVDYTDNSSEMERRMLGSIVDCLVARKRSGKVADVEEFVFNKQAVPSEHLRDLESLRGWQSPISLH